MFHMAGQTAGPIETKLDTRTHVHPGSVSVKVSQGHVFCFWSQWKSEIILKVYDRSVVFPRIPNILRMTVLYSAYHISADHVYVNRLYSK